MEIIQERLEREFDLDRIQTAPTVTYRIVKHDGTSEEIHSAGNMPSPDRYEKLLEPIARVSILIPAEYIGPMKTRRSTRRGVACRDGPRPIDSVSLFY